MMPAGQCERSGDISDMDVSHFRLTRKPRSGLSAAKGGAFTYLRALDFQVFCLILESQLVLRSVRWDDAAHLKPI